MRVLSIINQDNDRTGVFAQEIAARGDELVEWEMARGLPLEPLEAFDAILVFGGSMHVHEEDDYPWLREERRLLERALERGVPLFGACLGGQVLARAARASVVRAGEPEIGWYDVVLTAEAAADPIFGSLPARFKAFQWHSYTFELPPGAVALGRTPTCLQAYRLNGSAWGVQFHPEVDEATVADWISKYRMDPNAVRLGFDPACARSQARSNIGRWNEIGRTICGRFLDFAERRRR